MNKNSELLKKFWELSSLYREKLGVGYMIGVAADGRTLEDHIKRMEDAIEKGKPASQPEFEGIMD